MSMPRCTRKSCIVGEKTCTSTLCFCDIFPLTGSFISGIASGCSTGLVSVGRSGSVGCSIGAGVSCGSLVLFFLARLVAAVIARTTASASRMTMDDR